MPQTILTGFVAVEWGNRKPQNGRNKGRLKVDSAGGGRPSHLFFWQHYCH